MLASYRPLEMSNRSTALLFRPCPGWDSVDNPTDENGFQFNGDPLESIGKRHSKQKPITTEN